MWEAHWAATCWERITCEQNELEEETDAEETHHSVSSLRHYNIVPLIGGLALCGIIACWASGGFETQMPRIHSGFGSMISRALDLTAAEKMIHKYQGLIKELDVDVLQCTEGIEKLEELENPYVINVMLTAVGPRAKACSLAGYDVHKNIPTLKTKVCVIHCGEDDCPASLSFMQQHKEQMKHVCGSIIYLQGGAKCFLQSGLLQTDSQKCSSIVEPHALGEFKSLAEELEIKSLPCNGVMLEEISRLEKPFIINMMISALGERADACSLSDEVVHANAADDTAHGLRDILWRGSLSFRIVFLGEESRHTAQILQEHPFLARWGALLFETEGSSQKHRSMLKARGW
eukprot:CAMPEP_0172812134 /NCGR_PEP_ID=MMETSP1075-20121228/9853_1 /TAXON_ID=2916 /ORGANISM="Ceratium fusus, Strain PA161109" /LENGTH=345 /DNA_ID=CAMNT_0013651655 /DNA_START=82 /DNA_END=1115 /DNA_ORIENTATION=+